MVPIVIVDGGLRQREIARLLSAGAQDYFSEPFNVPLITERLDYLATAGRSRRKRGGRNGNERRG